MSPKIFVGRKTTRRQHEEWTSNQEPIQVSPMDFRNSSCQELFELDISNRSIIYGKVANFVGWESLGIKEMFDNISLHGVYDMWGDSCDRITGLFYANISATPISGGFKTYLYNTEVNVSPKVINELLGFAQQNTDAEGYYHPSRECDFARSAEGIEFMRQIHVNANIAGFVKPKARDLNVKARVVQGLISHTLLPRDGHRELVTWMDLYVMQKLYSSTLFDPGFLIVGHMMEVGQTNNKSLPYGTLIWRLVQRAQLRRTRVEIMRPLRDCDVFNITYLKLMKLVEVDGHWMSRADARGIGSTSKDVPMEDLTADRDFTATTGDFTAVAALPLFPQQGRTVEQRLDGLEHRFDSLEHKFDTLCQSVNDIRLSQLRMEEFFENWRKHSPPYPPPPRDRPDAPPQ